MAVVVAAAGVEAEVSCLRICSDAAANGARAAIAASTDVALMLALGFRCSNEEGEVYGNGYPKPPYKAIQKYFMFYV